MSNNNSGGISVLGILGAVFIVLKLLGTITWSWWFVLMPFYLGPVVVGIGLLIAAWLAMK